MQNPDDPNNKGDLIGDAREEIVGMAKQGMAHPSTKPVLTGAAVGAVAGILLPVVSLPIGLIAGAGFMLYKRLRP
jgi:di/tricarboxylate transporter